MAKWKNRLLNFAQEHYPESLQKWDYLIDSGGITQLNEMEQDDWEVLCEKYEEAYPEIDYKLGIVVVEAFKEFYEYKEEAQKSALTKNLMEASDGEREKLLNEMFGNDERAKADMRRILKAKFLAATNNDMTEGFDDGG